jgi:hypothetical protein
MNQVVFQVISCEVRQPDKQLDKRPAAALAKAGADKQLDFQKELIDSHHRQRIQFTVFQ